MSVHLVECAAELELQPSLKLALLCFADSGTNDGHIAMPGLEGVMKWCCVSRSQAFRLIAGLRELGLLDVHKHGYRGRRSEYVVFPNGCCDRHGMVPAPLRIVAGDDLAAAPEKGSHQCDSTLSTGSQAGCDPFASQQSHHDTGKGRIGPSERVSEPRSNATPPKALPPTTTTPVVVTTTGPLTSREPRGRTRSRLIPGCKHCDRGWRVDGDGLPIDKCPRCHPALTQGATA